MGITLAFEKTFNNLGVKKKELGVLPKQRGQKLKNVEPTKKIDPSLIESSKGFKRKYYATGSDFRSNAEIIAAIIKKETEELYISEVKTITPCESMIIPEFTISEKASILARKYKRQHYLMAKFSRMYNKHLSSAQIDLIFELARQCKDSSGK